MNRQEYDDDEIVLDLGGLADDYVRCLKKYWVQFLMILVLVAAGVIIVMNWRYKPQYQAKITYAVNKTGDTNLDASIAKRLSGGVSVLVGTGEFREVLFQEVEEESLNGNYSITSAYTEGANFFSITVSANNYKNSNLILNSLEKVYPEWASRSTGTLELQVVDRSEAGEQPVNPYSLMKMVVFGILGGLAVCFVFATLYALTLKTVRKESDMRKITNSSCISLIPDAKVKKRGKSQKQHLLVNNKRMEWGVKQSILAAQSRIQKQMEQNGQKVLLVTSTLPQEGKSLLAVNFALAFAERGKKVLLLDGDLRHPMAAQMLEMEEAPGLTEYLQQGGEIRELLQEQNELTVLQAGLKRSNVSSLADDGKMKELMEQLKQAFEFIIIDTPPSHLFSDAAILSRYADGVAYVVRHDFAEMKEIRKGIAPFQQSQKLLGYVLNRVHGGFSSYGKYGYGYGKYGKYGKYKRYTDLDEKSINTEDTL